MSNITVLGIDIAKDVFQLCGLNQANKVQFNQSVKRRYLLQTVLRYEGAVIAMEACGSAHYWGRLFRDHGYKVLLIPAQFVKSFSRGNKTDALDALAIAESSSRPGLHCVPIKTEEQQDYQALLRYRARQQSLAISAMNQARGILSEYGVVFPKGVAWFKKRIPEILEETGNGLTPTVRPMIQSLYEEYHLYADRIARIDRELKQRVSAHGVMGQLCRLRGIGPITAVTLFSSIGTGHQFNDARQLSAWIGLVPRQYGTGGKVKLGSVTKRGNPYLRALMIHGARSVMTWMKKKVDGLSLWAKQLVDRRGKHKTIVAVANKTARMVWVVLHRGIDKVPAHYLSAA